MERSIRVQRLGREDFRVDLEEGGERTVYVVSATEADVERLSSGAGAEALIEESFRFVLEREPRGKIPERFHLLLFARYHPDFLEEVPARLARQQSGGA